MTNAVTETLPAIEAHQLGKNYRSHRAVDSIDFTVQPGSVCALLGPNGAGKTTFLRLLTGLIHPSRGHSKILGSDSSSLMPSDWRRIA